MKDKKIKLSGCDGFNAFYGEIFGERWEKLKSCLTPDNIHAQLCFDGCDSYYLDPASVVSALCLPLNNSKKVLDMCAAPGGKTLVLSGNLPEDAVLFSNERSPQRKGRLAKVVLECLPADMHERVKTSCSDASTWCRRESECYDSILLDAPCSSERHVLNDPKYLNEWTPSRVKSIAMEQWALLSCAYRLVKKGGFILYSTCALCPQENDENLKKLLKKYGDCTIASKDEMEVVFRENLNSLRATVVPPDGITLDEIFKRSESTEYGLHALPDTANNTGPLFFSLIKKS